MALFIDRDRKLIEALQHDPAASPGYEIIKGVLVWPDEVPANLTSEGHSSLGDLLVARAILHHDPGRKTFSDELYTTAWQQARADGLRWPGFERLTLSADERAYYEDAKAETDF